MKVQKSNLIYVSFIGYKCIKLITPPPAHTNYRCSGPLGWSHNLCSLRWAACDPFWLQELQRDGRSVHSGVSVGLGSLAVKAHGIYALGMELFSCAVGSCRTITPVSCNNSEEVLRLVTEVGSMTSSAASLLSEALSLFLHTSTPTLAVNFPAPRLKAQGRNSMGSIPCKSRRWRRQLSKKLGSLPAVRTGSICELLLGFCSSVW